MIYFLLWLISAGIFKNYTTVGDDVLNAKLANKVNFIEVHL